MSTSEDPKSRRDFLTGWTESLTSKNDDGDAGPDVKNDLLPSSSNFLQHFSRRAMGCEFQIFFDQAEEKNFGATAMAVFEEIERLEDAFSIYRSSSEISRVNRTAQFQPTQLSDDLVDILELGLKISRQTKGAFDLTSTPLVRAWGFLDRKPRVPTQEAIADALQHVAWDKVKLDTSAQTVSLEPNQELNLNSIGKGFALDRAAVLIRQSGIDRFVIHGGQSSVLARKSNEVPIEVPSDGWLVGITHPLIPQQRIGEILLRNETMATSGTARQGFFHQGRRLGHLIDPRTGWPTSHHLSATVVCDNAALCDAIATAFFVMETEDVAEYCRQHPEVKALMILPSDESQQPWKTELFNFPPDQIRWH